MDRARRGTVGFCIAQCCPVVNRVTQWDPPSWDNTFPEDMDFDVPEQEPEPEEESKQKTTTTAAADTSSEVAKKLKEQFRKQVSFCVKWAGFFGVCFLLCKVWVERVKAPSLSLTCNLHR